MNLVQTAVGLIERDKLTVQDFITEEPGKRFIATEWYLDGEMVKRDVWGSILNGLDIFGEQGKF